MTSEMSLNHLSSEDKIHMNTARGRQQGSITVYWMDGMDGWMDRKGNNRCHLLKLLYTRCYLFIDHLIFLWLHS